MHLNFTSYGVLSFKDTCSETHLLFWMVSPSTALQVWCLHKAREGMLEDTLFLFNASLPLVKAPGVSLSLKNRDRV